MAKSVPASIRNKNPGAMWIKGNPIAIKWGASPEIIMLADGKGQGNNIAKFKTYMDGICAQIDLWRSSNHYKNKPFKEGIATWSGGNSVPSYIKLVKERVPGMTGDTIINDSFLRGPMCIPFLKAQAFHEAGEEYPAADADWIEAQRRVFAGITPVKTAAVNVQMPTADIDKALQEIQIALVGFGYFEIGNTDGRIGSKTLGAIKGFYNDRGVTARAEYPSPDLMPEIRQAKAEKWSRPIDPSRAYASETIVASKVASVAPARSAGLLQTITGWFTGGATLAGTAVKLLPDTNEQASPYISVVQQFIPSIPQLFFFAVIAVICIVTAYQINKSKRATVDDYQTGKIN